MAAGCGPEPLAAEGTLVQWGAAGSPPWSLPAPGQPSWGSETLWGAPGRLRVPASPRRWRLVKPSGAVGLLLRVASAGRDNELTHTGGTTASKQFFPLSCSFLFFFNLVFISSYGNHEYV